MILGEDVATASAMWERLTGYTPTTTQYRLTCDGIRGRALCLPRQPVVSVDSVEYRDVNGTWTALTGFTTDLGSSARICFDNAHPTNPGPQTPGLRITFTAGHSSAEAVPRPVCTAIRNLAQQYSKNREIRGDQESEIPPNFEWIAASYRLDNLGEVWQTYDTYGYWWGHRGYFN